MRASLRLALPISGLLVLAGYFGPWVGHSAAGLVILGLDLGEYVKFLPAIRTGETMVWREGFYLPLFVVSLTLSLHAFRDWWSYGWAWRAALLALAAVAALNMLPPAWTPSLLATPEFRLQTAAIAMCLGAILFSPLLSLLPSLFVAASLVLLCALAIGFPVSGFLTVLPEIESLYNHAIAPAWGLWLTVAGLIALAAVVILGHFGPRGERSSAAYAAPASGPQSPAQPQRSPAGATNSPSRSAAE